MPSIKRLSEFVAVYENNARKLAGITHDDVKSAKTDYVYHHEMGHGTHEIEHPKDATHGPSQHSHPYAYAHHDKKTGKTSAVQIKSDTTTAQHVARAMGHKEVGKHHHAIADYHNSIWDE